VRCVSHSSQHDSPTRTCSGLNAYRELTEAGLDVRIFERDSVPGGNWHYTEEVPLDAPVPNAPTPISDFVPSLPPAGVELPYSEVFENDGKIQRDHRGPKPIWESLTSNAPSVCWFMSCGS
jgi:cation diffusion facilitator CzcD-associated flavoprotein CzcO